MFSMPARGNRDWPALHKDASQGARASQQVATSLSAHVAPAQNDDRYVLKSVAMAFFTPSPLAWQIVLV
jgi:hypothetical protein